MCIKWSCNTTRWCNAAWFTNKFTTKWFKDFISKVIGQLVTESHQFLIKWPVTVNGHNILTWDRILVVILTRTFYSTDRLAKRCDRNISIFHDVLLNFGDRVTFLVKGHHTKKACKILLMVTWPWPIPDLTPSACSTP